MAKNIVVNPKDFFKIVTMHEFENIKPARIYDYFYKKYSFATVYRIATNNKSASSMTSYLRNQVIRHKSNYDKFIEKTWNYFPFPEFWPADKLCAVIQYSSQHSYIDIKNNFNLQFGTYKLEKLFTCGDMKKAAKTKCIKKQETKKPEIEVARVAEKETVAELIRKLKKMTGAKEVIIKV